MKIEVDGLELIVRDIKYKQKLELKGEFHDVYRNGVDNVKQKEFNSLLGSVAEIAFSDPESGLKEYDYDSELKILTKAMMEYLELSDESKKSRWGLSFAVWCWVFDIQPHDQYTLPYSAQSPISKKVKDFNTINDIWERST